MLGRQNLPGKRRVGPAMIVRGLGAVPASAPPLRTERAGAAFALPAGQAPPAAPTAPASPALMLALQEDAPPAGERQRRARDKARRLLAGLRNLQLALLAPGGEAAVLDELAAAAEPGPPTGDPALDAAMGALALRVAVELARRGR